MSVAVSFLYDLVHCSGGSNARVYDVKPVGIINMAVVGRGVAATWKMSLLRQRIRFFPIGQYLVSQTLSVWGTRLEKRVDSSRFSTVEKNVKALDEY